MGASAIDYVGGSGDEALALLEQIVGAGREWIERTSRHGKNLVPYSPANRAVINEPDRSAASITTTASEIPEISRLRRGKVLAAWREAGRALAEKEAGRHSRSATRGRWRRSSLTFAAGLCGSYE